MNTMNTTVFNFLFSFTSRVIAFNMLRLRREIGRNLGVLAPHFCNGELSGNRHSSASFGAEATSCGKVSRMSVEER